MRLEHGCCGWKLAESEAGANDATRQPYRVPGLGAPTGTATPPRSPSEASSDEGAGEEKSPLPSFARGRENARSGFASVPNFMRVGEHYIHMPQPPVGSRPAAPAQPRVFGTAPFSTKVGSCGGFARTGSAGAGFAGTGLGHGLGPRPTPGASFAAQVASGRFGPGAAASGRFTPSGAGVRPPPFRGVPGGGMPGMAPRTGFDGFPPWAKAKFPCPPKAGLLRPPPVIANHYHALGLKPGAQADDVRKAYRKLALQHHPDKNADHPDATAKFRQVKEAYEAICRLNG